MQCFAPTNTRIDMADHYTVEGLQARGWTTSMIRTYLRKPDDQRSNPHGRLRKAISLYQVDRVHDLEAGAAKHDLEKMAEGRALAKRALDMMKKKRSQEL